MSLQGGFRPFYSTELKLGFGLGYSCGKGWAKVTFTTKSF